MMRTSHVQTPSLFQRVLTANTEGTWPQIGIAGLRIGVGVLVATLHGWHKVIEGWQYATAGTDWPLVHDTVALGFPLPAMSAALATLSQFAGGWLLAIGAFTRVAAFLVAVTMVTAVMFNLQVGGPDAQLAGLYALASGVFVLIGGGWWSVDRALSRGGR